MTEVARFFDSQSYGESDQAEVTARMVRDGICIGVGSELAVTSGVAGFVSVNTGEAFVQGFWYKNTAVKTLAVSSNVTAITRVDVVVLRLDRTGNALVAAVHEGTPGGGVPPLTQVVGGIWEMPLANLSTTSGVTTIADARVWQSNMYNPMTTAGDIVVADARGVAQRKAKGANGSYLGVDGAGNLNYSVPIGFANPMAAAGDIIVGGAGGAAGRAPIGAGNSIFGVNAAGVLGYYTDPNAVIPAGTLHPGRLTSWSGATYTNHVLYDYGSGISVAKVQDILCAVNSIGGDKISDNTIHGGNKIIDGTVGTVELAGRSISNVFFAQGAATGGIGSGSWQNASFNIGATGLRINETLMVVALQFTASYASVGQLGGVGIGLDTIGGPSWYAHFHIPIAGLISTTIIGYHLAGAVNHNYYALNYTSAGGSTVNGGWPGQFVAIALNR
jgi:hypothetical protein